MTKKGIAPEPPNPLSAALARLGAALQPVGEALATAAAEIGRALNRLEGAPEMTTATHPDEAALRGAILDAPGDDTVRLAYADCIEENAKETDCPQFGYEPGEFHALCARCQGRGVVPDGRRDRAEFIRVQITLARGANWQDQLGCRSGALLTRHGEGWGWAGSAHTDDEQEFRRSRHDCAWWRRGFVFAVRLPPEAFERHARDLFEQPPIEEVRLPGLRIEIDPPGEGHGWQLYYYEPDGTDHIASSLGLDTRAEMVERLMADVPDMLAEMT